MSTQRDKGNRYNSFVDDYTVFDLEATDKIITYAKIIEMGAVRVRNGEIVDSFQTLVNPRMPIPTEVSSITGITNDMVADAPHIEEVLDSFIDFIGDDILVGHNITTFDTNLLYDELMAYRGEKLQNDYIDTLYISQRGIDHNSIENYKLSSICDYFCVNREHAHRALNDCIMTHDCYQKLADLHESTGFALESCSRSGGGWRSCYSEDTVALQTLQNLLKDITSDDVLTREEIQLLTEWVVANRHLEGNYPFDVVLESLRKVLADRIVEPAEKEELLSIFKELIEPVEAATHNTITCLEGQHCVITGDFNYGSRKEVIAFIESNGGIIDKSVKKATNYVIVGEKGSDAWSQGNYGNKVKAALDYNANKGCCIEIVKEADFFEEMRKCDE